MTRSLVHAHPLPPPRRPAALRRPLAALLGAFLAALLALCLPISAHALAGPHDGLPPAPEGLDRSTPRRAMRVFIDEARAGRLDRAAYALDLSGVEVSKQPARSVEIARQLKVVLDRKLWIVWEDLSDDPAGNPEDGASTDRVGTIPLGTAAVPITLSRSQDLQGAPVWLISRATVSLVPDLYEAHGPGWLAEKLPAWARDVRFLELSLWQWIGALLVPLLSWVAGVVLARIVLGAVARLVRRTEATWDDVLLARTRSPLRVLCMLLAMAALISPLHLSVPVQGTADRVLESALILAGAWLVTRLVDVGAAAVNKRLAERSKGALEARGNQTRIAMLQRIGIVAILVVAAALVLLQFEVVRQVGVSLLASAGIAGVMLGFAAQRSIATLLAGLQLSFSEPVRIGDTVIVEGEWGTIEEITLTYVVVKIWDLRRLVIPISYFLEKPFQNWTKVSPELLGTVFVHADYTVPVDLVREEVTRLCKEDPAWDGKASGLVVVDATPDTLSLRALVSAKDASDQWNLRCRVREGMVKFLQQLEGGRYLPKTRVAVQDGAGSPAG